MSAEALALLREFLEVPPFVVADGHHGAAAHIATLIERARELIQRTDAPPRHVFAYHATDTWMTWFCNGSKKRSLAHLVGPDRGDGYLRSRCGQRVWADDQARDAVSGETRCLRCLTYRLDPETRGDLRCLTT